ncbi:hypothetical protein F2Q68_00026204 [Brassica cretica]|uniref:Uncharacterized protein n=1 Tax=Brassica cretica TaxID=69181 RepID=A0A8S9I7A9_BRACR|nr:hypothetical protein F2Q68_00026204 [Brassica cretica]
MWSIKQQDLAMKERFSKLSLLDIERGHGGRQWWVYQAHENHPCGILLLLRERKFEDGADSSSSQATENKRPPGVKAAKASGKKMMAEENALNEFQILTVREYTLGNNVRMSEEDKNMRKEVICCCCWSCC